MFSTNTLTGAVNRIVGSEPDAYAEEDRVCLLFHQATGIRHCSTWDQVGTYITELMAPTRTMQPQTSEWVDACIRLCEENCIIQQHAMLSVPAYSKWATIVHHRLMVTTLKKQEFDRVVDGESSAVAHSVHFVMNCCLNNKADDIEFSWTTWPMFAPFTAAVCRLYPASKLASLVRELYQARTRRPALAAAASSSNSRTV